MSTSVLRRYTPPTCTLEIAAKGSALSKWTDRAVLKNLRFQLSFDDPTVPEDQQVEIRGDRTQLEALWEAVSVYVQEVLGQSGVEVSERSDRPIELIHPLALVPPKTGIYLQPKGWLRHELHLGTLANERSGGVVPLSALQLFDLANALDDYHAEALTLPALNRPAWIKSPSGWASVAAVFLLAVGTTATLTKFVTDVSAPSPQLASAPAASADAGLSSQSKSAVRLPIPPGTEPLPSALALQPLPPLPPAGATKNAAPSQRVSVPQVAPIAPTVPTAPAGPSGGQVAVIPQDVPSTLSLPGGSSADTSIASAESARSALPTGVLPPSAALRPDAESRSQITNSTAFDAIPQVAEVRNYFQENWKPPEGLTQTLEYRLVLNADGTLQRIMPLGQAAATFLDRTNMPLLNEPFVSPTESGNTPQIRLVLGQDGKVQTFLEGGR